MINALYEIVAYQVHVRQVQVRISNQVRVLPLNVHAHVYLKILARSGIIRRLARIVIHECLNDLFLVYLFLLTFNVKYTTRLAGTAEVWIV
jgi:hypothetical protein